MAEAADWCRQRQGPALVHAQVVRPYSHSMSDDERAYKPEVQRVEELKGDPLMLMADLLVERGIETKNVGGERQKLAAIYALLHPAPRRNCTHCGTRTL